nr:hypothetical protein [Tanacetum cinerariifolium]
TKVESIAFKETVMDKEESSKQGRKITNIDVVADVNQENVTDANGKAVVEEMLRYLLLLRLLLMKLVLLVVKDKGKAKLVEEPKVLKSRKAQIAIDEEVARRIETEWNADIKDNID